MNQYDPKHLFQTLKRLLKEKKISYRELATRVSFSEGTIKNMFHFEDAPVQRIFEISQAIGIPFPDLVSAAYAHNSREFSFTLEQERFFADHPEHYNFFRKIFFAKQEIEQVQKNHHLTDRSTQRYLQNLEKIGVLKRHLKGKITFTITGRLKWIPGGPWMQKYFRTYSQKITEQVLAHPECTEHLCSFSFATLSRANRDLFYLEIKEVAEKYKDISYKEYLVGRPVDAVPVTWLFSMVPVDIVSHHEDIPNL